MGDMNLHNQSENSMIAEFGYRDLWAETHFSNQKDFDDNDEGITFDVNVSLSKNDENLFFRPIL